MNNALDDTRLLIEVIKLLGTVSKDESCGELLCEQGTILQAIDLLKSKLFILIYLCHSLDTNYLNFSSDEKLRYY